MDYTWQDAPSACGFCRHVDKRRIPVKKMFAHKTWTAAKKEFLWGTPAHRLHKCANNTNTQKKLKNKTVLTHR
jgi:hypothetical protein